MVAKRLAAAVLALICLWTWTAEGQTTIQRAYSSVTALRFPAGSTLTESTSGKLLITGTTPMVLFGDATSSSPALKKNSATLQVRLADDSAFATLLADQFTPGNKYNLATSLAFITAPSAPSSCGTSPAVTNSNGSVSFLVTGGTGGTATGCTVTMPTAAAGWNCSVVNITQTAAHRADRTTVQTASTTTSVTWEYQAVSTGAATAFTASDVFRGICFPF